MTYWNPYCCEEIGGFRRMCFGIECKSTSENCPLAFQFSYIVRCKLLSCLILTVMCPDCYVQTQADTLGFLFSELNCQDDGKQ
jgi:hypothetical protein